MHILFFSHYFPPEGNAPATRTHAHCRHWTAQGHETTVVTGVPNCPDGVVYEGYRNRLYQRGKVDGIDVRRVWTYVAANKGTVRRIVNYISYMIAAFVCALRVRKPDVVIATSPQFFCGWAGVLYCWVRRVPLVLEVRDIWPESILAVGAMRRGTLVRILEWLERKMYGAADHIVTVGEGYKRRLLGKGVPEHKVSVVMNGVDRELFTPCPPDENLKQTWGVAGQFVCGYVGTIGMACGLHVVLDAAAMLKQRAVDDVVFLLVGDGAQRAPLVDQAEARGLDNVVFTGRQPKAMMPGYLAIMDVCLVHLRKTDLFSTVMPSKIFEAAAMGRPIVNGVAGFAAEFIDKAGAGVNIESENAKQLVESILALKSDPLLRDSLGRSGRQYVTAHYDREKLAADYLAVLEKVSGAGED